MRDLPDPPPFAKLLRGDLLPEHLHLDDALDNMRINTSPFNQMEDFQCELRPDAAHRLGLQMESCPRYQRAYVSAFNRPFGSYSRRTANRRFLGSYIIRVGDTYTFSPADVERALDSLCSRDTPPPHVTVRLAIDQHVTLSDDRPPPPSPSSPRHPSHRCSQSCRRGGYSSRATSSSSSTLSCPYSRQHSM